MALLDEMLWFRIDDRPADGRARRAATGLAERLGFSSSRVAEVGIVAAELTANVARHAGGGLIGLRRLAGGATAGIDLFAIDAGPGIADLPTVSLDGCSTAGTLGIGLGAIERLSTVAEIYSAPGRGTVVHAVLWPGDRMPDITSASGLARPMTNEEVCGDAYVVIDEPRRRLLVLADGLGHGPLAAVASRAAVQVALDREGGTPLEVLLQEMHARLRQTRGAAVAVAELDWVDRVVRFAGVGNVSGWVVTDRGRQGMPSKPGIVGGQALRPLRPLELPLGPELLVVLHSDGLSEKWDLLGYPGLRGRSPALLAAVLLRDAGVHHDDASVLVSVAR